MSTQKPRTEDSSAPAKRVVTQSDLLAFYHSIKSAETIDVFNAAEALRDGDVARAHGLLETARNQYERKYRRTLASDPATSEGRVRSSAKQIEKAKARKERAQLAMETFDDFLRMLGRTVQIRRAVPKTLPEEHVPFPQTSRRENKTEQTESSAASLANAFVAEFRAAADPEAEERLIRREFVVEPVTADCDLMMDALYGVFAGGQWNLFRVTDPISDTVPIRNALSGRTARPIPKAAVVKAGKNGGVLRLVSRQPTTSSKSDDAEVNRADVVLDENEFNVLWSIVRDTGLLSNASEITLVQKNEFRKGKYDKARKQMEFLHGSFGAASRTRRAALDRELRELEAKKRDLPLREVEKKKTSIARELRLIERAESHFLKVVNSVRALESRQR